MASENIKPIIGITIGDAAGIGPEVSLKAAADASVSRECRPVLIGSLAHLREAARVLKIPISVVPHVPESAVPENVVEVIDAGSLPHETPTGIDHAVTGKASAEWIKEAVRLCTAGAISAIATAPISKKAIALGGYNFPGHTEFLAELTSTERFAMSFFAESLRVVLLSTHVPLSTAIDMVTKDRLIDTIRFTQRHLSELLNRDIRLAVAGLNPHASENGMFGDEESREIVPAVEICRDEFGIDVSGPYSPDTIFLRGYRGEFDAIVACYHDQATIAVKALSFGSSVNVTLGLPIIRTSVDHGTAFDIAGKGIADASSMKAAIRLAADLVLIRDANRR
ncbi:MAG: 4-hydroxythreonine-4-phosphate dehydrogenase PdxA [Pyrinomonadaceae bacterium]